MVRFRDEMIFLGWNYNQSYRKRRNALIFLKKNDFLNWIPHLAIGLKKSLQILLGISDCSSATYVRAKI